MATKAYVAFECSNSCCCPKEVLGIFAKKEDAINFVKSVGTSAKDRLDGRYSELLDTPFNVDSEGQIAEIRYVYGCKIDDPKYIGNHKYPGYFVRSYDFEIEEAEIIGG